MNRQTESADQIMLRVARQIVRKEGWSALRIRELVQRADVNLGMFHYHFRSKENFKKAVLEEFYEEFYQRFIVVSRAGNDPLLQLKNSLLTLGRTVRDERTLILSLLRDAVNEDSEIIELIGSSVRRHATVMVKLIKQCQKQGIITKIPISQAMSFLMSSMNFPIVLGAFLERPCSPLPKKWVNEMNRDIMTDEAIAQRVSFALKGLKP